MFDIILLSYDEPYAEKAYANLKEKYSFAKHVHGISGIGNAHYAASKMADTSFFYVVDADAEIVTDFDFSYKPTVDKKHFVHIWQAINPAINMTYGYGGVKLFHTSFFKGMSSYVDFSTSLTKDVEYMPQVSCITRFNSDEFRSFRGAYRETAKLYHSIKQDKFVNVDHKKQVNEYLEAWKNPVNEASFREFILMGVECALADYESISREMNKINNFDFLKVRFKQCSSN